MGIMIQLKGVQTPHLGGLGGDQRPHVEFAIQWSPVNVHHVLVLLDTGAECSLIRGSPEHFLGTPAVIDGYEGKAIRVKKAQISLGIGHLSPKEYTVYISPIPEYILGVDILQGLWLQTTAGKLRLRIHVVKALLRRHAKHPPVALPVPQWITTTK